MVIPGKIRCHKASKNIVKLPVINESSSQKTGDIGDFHHDFDLGGKLTTHWEDAQDAEKDQLEDQTYPKGRQRNHAHRKQAADMVDHLVFAPGRDDPQRDADEDGCDR